jgi:hypothetical protein
MLKVKEWRTKWRSKSYELNKWYVAGYSAVDSLYFLYLREITVTKKNSFRGEYIMIIAGAFRLNSNTIKDGYEYSTGAFEKIFREASAAEIKYYNLPITI